MTALRNQAEAEDVANEMESADPSQGRWSQLEMLLALVVDELRATRYVYVSANSKTPPEAPEPIPRPGVKPGGKSRKMTQEQYEWLFKHINSSEPTEVS